MRFCYSPDVIEMLPSNTIQSFKSLSWRHALEWQKKYSWLRIASNLGHFGFLYAWRTLFSNYWDSSLRMCSACTANTIKGRTITSKVPHPAWCVAPNKMGLGVGGWAIVAPSGPEVRVGPCPSRSERDPEKERGGPCNYGLDESPNHSTLPLQPRVEAPPHGWQI